MAVKFTKGQISNGTISKKYMLQGAYLFHKVHNFHTMPLYYHIWKVSLYENQQKQ